MGRLLAEADLKPHPSRYWWHPPDPEFRTQVEDICQLYQPAAERAERREFNFSLDEMPGIQAWVRTMPDIAMKPGRRARVEFEFLRHGSQPLVCGMDQHFRARIHAIG